MYLTEPNLWAIVRKQVQYKLHASIGAFTSLIFAQLIAFAFSFGGSSQSSSSGSMDFTLSVKYFSGDIIFIFTVGWALIAGISLTNRAKQDAESLYVTNRLTSHLSNIAFLLIISLFAGITTPLLGSFLRAVVYLTSNHRHTFVNDNIALTPAEMLVGLLLTFLTASLLSCFGYVAGMLVRLSKLFLFVLPGLLLGFLYIETRLIEGYGVIASIYRFYGTEPSLLLFCLKVLLTLAILYPAIIWISRNMEVRQ